MDRRKDVYNDDGADQFRPERWAEETLSNIRRAYLQINGGLWLCLGHK